jgi:4-amino-4-deoxy-L-arabinose transferase-like glycosyltransferase
MAETGNTKKAGFLLVIAVLLFAVVTAFWTISDGALDNHECLVSVTAREMLQTGDWILPRFNGEIRLQKTPLCYWLVASVATVTGKVDEFSTRLPSVCFAILSAAAVLYFTAQWLGIGIAALSTAVWVSTLAFVRHSHSGRPEMALCSLVAVSMLSFYSAMQAQSRRHQILYMLVFWLSFAFAMLAKGPAPLAIVLPPLFCYFAAFRQWNKILYFISEWFIFPIAVLSTVMLVLTLVSLGRPHNVRLFWLSFVPALVLVVLLIFFCFVIFRQWCKTKFALPIIGGILFWLIVLPWPIIVAAKAPGGWAFWKREFIDRFMGDYASGHKPFWYYLPVTFLFAAPFSAFVLYSIAAPFRSVWGGKRAVMWYLWLWFVVQIAVMSISGGKRQHYILPAFPAFSILAGICLYDMIFELKVFNLKEVKILFTGHIIAAIAAAAGLLYWAFVKEKAFIWPAVHIVMMLAVVVGLVVFLFGQKKKVSATILIFAGYCAILLVAYVYFFNPLDYNTPSKIFSTRIGSIVPADQELIACNYVSARTIQYAGRTIPEIQDFAEVRSRYEKSAWVIATGDDYQDMLKAGGFEVVFYKRMAERHGQEDVEGALFHKSGSK